VNNTKRTPVISLTIFFLILLSTGLSGYYVWQGFSHGFDKYLPILCSTLLLDGLGVFALVFKVSFETRRRAMVPFVASLSLLIVCSIHLAALANMRVGVISQDEQDTRTKTLDDDRHARNVQDANALVALNCQNCKPERRRRMYQSEMARLEKADRGVMNTSTNQDANLHLERSWGRRYVEDYATAVQLIFGLLCGLAMLVNNFLRMYATDPTTADEVFPHELDTQKQSPARRSNLTPKMTTSDDIVDDTRNHRKTTPDDTGAGFKPLREALKLIAFEHPPGHFKVDLSKKGDYLIIRHMESNRGDEATTHSCRARLTLLDDAVRMERSAFRERLEKFLQQNGFDI
jgi:hypothetical protein